MKKYLTIIFVVVTIFSALFVFPILPAKADTASCNAGPGNILPPCICSGNCQLRDFLALGANLISYGVGILSVVALFFIIYGGFSFLIAMGNPEKIDAGKKIMGGTLRGLAIVLLSWTMVNTIIFLFTGSAYGNIFGDKKWYDFKTGYSTVPPKEIGDVCETKKFQLEGGGEVEKTTYCTNTSITPYNGDLAKINDAGCYALGICVGGDEIICCPAPTP